MTTKEQNDKKPWYEEQEIQPVSADNEIMWWKTFMEPKVKSEAKKTNEREDLNKEAR